MERRAKDGTYYQRVGVDSWEPVTRAAKDGTTYKKIGKDEWAPLDPPKAEEPKPQSLVEQLGDSFENAGRSVLSGLTLGASEPVFSGINALATAKSLSPDDLKAAYDADVERRRLQRERMAVGDVVGQVAGSLAPQSAASNLAKGAASAATSGAKALGITGQSALGKIALGGAQGAATGAALTGASNLVGETTGFLKEGEAPSIKDSGIVGGVLGAAIPAAPLVWKGTKEAGKLGMSAFLGPKREAINRYLERAEQVRGAKSVEEIKNVMDDAMASIFDDVEKAKISKDEAKEAVKMVESKFRDATREAQFQFRIKQADIKQMLNESKQGLENSFKAKTESLSAIKSPIQLADDVQTSLGDLKRQVSKLSSESADILGQQKGSVRVDQLVKAIDDIEDGLYIGQGAQKVLRSNDAEAALPSLQKWREKLYALSDEQGNIPLRTLKDVVKGIDSDAKKFGDRMAGSFSGAGEQTMYALRGNIDGVLKDVPEYAAKMQETAEAVKLLKEASKLYGTPQAAVSKLNAIAGRTKGREREVLGALGSATGRDYLSPVDEFVSAQSTLKDPRALEQIKRGLPEYKQFRLQSMAQAQAARPEAQGQFVQGEINKLGLPQQRAQAEQALSAAEQRLLGAEETLKPLKSLTPMNTQNAVQGLMKQPGKENIELRRTVEQLSKMSGKDFQNWIDDRRALDQFKGEFRIGSRNVNLWAVMGFFGGGGVQGAAVAAPIGAMVDRFGPAAAQKILDGVLKIQGAPTVQKINSLKLPGEAKTYLINQLSLAKSRAAGVGAIPRRAAENQVPSELDENSSVPANERVFPDGGAMETPKRGPEKWASDGFDKVAKVQPGLDRDSLMRDPRSRELLMRASSLREDSPAMTRLVAELSRGGRRSK